jgi:hypothetical protein
MSDTATNASIIVPDDYAVLVFVSQWHEIAPAHDDVVLPQLPIGKQLNQITEWLKGDIGRWNGGAYTTLALTSELHVLRLLRHVRETVDGIRLKPDQLRMYFDSVDEQDDYRRINVTDDGDLASPVAGGFFCQRLTELF